MAGEWHTVKLGSILGEKGYIRGPFGSALRRGELKADGIPVYEQQHAIGDIRSFRYFIDEDKFAELARFAVRPHDLIISCSGTLGQVSVIREGDPIGIISQALLLLRPDVKVVAPMYLYYFLSSAKGYYSITSLSSGSVQVNIARRSIIEDIEIPLPPMREQQAIASILGALDDKIELDRRMNQTLEAMARAIFKSWFVDLDPLRAKAEGRHRGLPRYIAGLFPDAFEPSELGQIPRGWTTMRLSETGIFLNGLALQKYPPGDGDSLPVIKIAQLRKGSTEGADEASAEIDEDYIVEDGDVLFSWSGSLECVLWTGGRGALNQHLFKVTSNRFSKWFLYLWIHEHLRAFRHIAAGKATTMGHIQRHHLDEAQVIVPAAPVLARADQVIGPLIDASVSRSLECRHLAAVRDALLPKLISGELRVPDAERIVGRAI